MGFNRDERIFVLERYFATKSYIRVQSEFVEKFPGSPAPNKSTIKRLVDRFRINGDVKDQTKNQRRKEENNSTIEKPQKADRLSHRLPQKKKLQKCQDDEGVSQEILSIPDFDYNYELLEIDNAEEEVDDPVTIVSVKFDEEDDEANEEPITEVYNDEKMKQFIEEVRKKPSLYSINDKDYGNTNRRRNLWTEIAKTCNFPNGAAAQEVWKNLVDNYATSRASRSNSTCGDSVMDRYESLMSFLGDEMYHNESSSAEARSPVIDRLNSGSSSVPIARKSGKIVGNTILQYLDDKRNGSQDLDDDDLGLKAFFLSAYHSTQKLNKARQVEVKKKISDILFDAEMNS